MSNDLVDTKTYHNSTKSNNYINQSFVLLLVLITTQRSTHKTRYHYKYFVFWPILGNTEMFPLTYY